MFRGPATLAVPGQAELHVRTLDISAGGLGVVAPFNPPLGIELILRVPLPRPTQPVTVLVADVRVTNSVFVSSDNGFRVGLCFVALTAAEDALLRDFLRQRR